MKKIDANLLQEMKPKLDVELMGVVSLERSDVQELKKQAAALLPGVRSVVVFGKEVFKEVVALLGPSKGVGEAELGELLKPHSDYLNGRLTRAAYDLAAIFRKEGLRSLPMAPGGCPTDQRFLKAALSYKNAAQLAGLGTIGRHSLLVTPEFGPRVRLSCLLTEAPAETHASPAKNNCRACDACIRACPSQALQTPGPGEPYSMNKFACRTYRNTGLTCAVCVKTCDEAFNS